MPWRTDHLHGTSEFSRRSHRPVTQLAMKTITSPPPLHVASRDPVNAACEMAAGLWCRASQPTSSANLVCVEWLDFVIKSGRAVMYRFAALMQPRSRQACRRPGFQRSDRDSACVRGRRGRVVVVTDPLTHSRSFQKKTGQKTSSSGAGEIFTTTPNAWIV
jgi:hypothetical protein